MAISGPNERHFKFRAESEPDMFRFVKGVLDRDERAKGFNVTRIDSGVTCELVTTLAIDHLRDLNRVGTDLHVIAETIAPLADYTGKRAYPGR